MPEGWYNEGCQNRYAGVKMPMTKEYAMPQEDPRPVKTALQRSWVKAADDTQAVVSLPSVNPTSMLINSKGKVSQGVRKKTVEIKTGSDILEERN